MRGRLWKAGAIAALLLVPRLAAAQASDPGAAKFDEGVSAYEKGNYPAAIDAFRDAYAASKNANATYLWNLALAEIKADRSYDALVHLRAYQKSPDATPQNVERAGKLIERVVAKVGHLSIVAPDAAEVYVDSNSVGKAPLAAPIEVDPSKPHLVEARRAGQVAHSNVAPPGNAQVDVKLTFPEAPPPPPIAIAPAAPAPRTIPARVEEPSGGVPKEGLLAGLVITETLISAGCTGIGAGILLDKSSDSTRQAIGGTLVGGGILFFTGDILTMVLWPRSARPKTGAVSDVRVSPSFGGVSLRGAF